MQTRTHSAKIDEWAEEGRRIVAVLGHRPDLLPGAIAILCDKVDYLARTEGVKAGREMAKE